jgi:SOS response regulatory protein OraA/RecX
LRTVTGLREQRNGRILVELDGRAWRAFPADAAARAGLALGLALDRERLRLLARELRRSRALTVASRTLRHRDVPERAVAARLERARVPAAARGEALDALVRAGVVDDERFSVGRARALAERGYGDAAIRWRLEHEGLAAELVERAVAALEPERDRARRLVARRGSVTKRGEWLARRGFGEEAIESALAGPGGADA